LLSDIAEKAVKSAIDFGAKYADARAEQIRSTILG